MLKQARLLALLVPALAFSGCLEGAENLLGGCPPSHHYGGATVTYTFNDTAIPPDDLTALFNESEHAELTRGGELVPYYLGKGYHGVWEFRRMGNPENVSGEARGYAADQGGPLHTVAVTLRWRTLGDGAHDTDLRAYEERTREPFARDLANLDPHADALEADLRSLLGAPSRILPERLTETAAC